MKLKTAIISIYLLIDGKADNILERMAYFKVKGLSINGSLSTQSVGQPMGKCLKLIARNKQTKINFDNMTNTIKTTFPSLFCVAMFFTSCDGQVKTNTPKDPATITTGQPKVVKTQGSTQSDNVRCGVQDQAGNLWFGFTGEGVYRYDGKTFTQFNLWFASNGEGVFKCDGKTIYRRGHHWFLYPDRQPQPRGTRPDAVC